MKSTTTNCYKDSLSENNNGRGVDIASQRLDDLDQMAVSRIAKLINRGYSENVQVLDLGAGQGGFSKSLTKDPHLTVFALDREDYAECYDGTSVQFLQADLKSYLKNGPTSEYDVILCQRTIHYFDYVEALRTLRYAYDALTVSGHLFISASGITSELADNYPTRRNPLDFRFGYLAKPMRDKHGIHEPVCLYDLYELCHLLKSAGFAIDKAWVSEFGNIKVVARCAPSNPEREG